MKITDRIYKTSGVEYGTNSNTFAVDTDAGIVLLDLGYETKQWNINGNILSAVEIRHRNLWQGGIQIYRFFI